MKRTLLLLLLLVVASSSASAVIDPFYRNRMESGIRAFEQGNWEAAEHQLRIACFGHLDEPATLVGGLVRLAIVEVRRGEESSFRQIFSRLAELEERFSAYSTAQLPPELRRQFEGLAAGLVPAQALRATEGFGPIAERAEIEMLGAMPPEQRRGELHTRLQVEPERADWLNELARLELAARKPQLALDWLDRLPAEAGELPPAICLRQQAASEAGDCVRMDLTRPFCENVPPSVVEFRLQCLVEAGSWPEASNLILGLDPEIRGRRRVARLERKVRNNSDGSDQIAPSATDSPIVTMPPSGPAPTRAPVDPQELDRLRQRLASAATSDELAALMSEAESFADRHPDVRQGRLLAAEVAYLLSDWPAAVRHFRQAGQLRFDEAHLSFYQAVALYESGDPTTAAEVLRPVASQLERSSFVDSYVDRILAAGI